jgi:hypothetical protein
VDSALALSFLKERSGIDSRSISSQGMVVEQRKEAMVRSESWKSVPIDAPPDRISRFLAIA